MKSIPEVARAGRRVYERHRAIPHAVPENLTHDLCWVHGDGEEVLRALCQADEALRAGEGHGAESTFEPKSYSSPTRQGTRTWATDRARIGPFHLVRIRRRAASRVAAFRMARIRGSLDSARPVITIAVSASSGPSTFVDAVIDTGFTGFVQLPARTAQELGLTPRATSETRMLTVGLTPSRWPGVRSPLRTREPGGVRSHPAEQR